MESFLLEPPQVFGKVSSGLLVHWAGAIDIEIPYRASTVAESVIRSGAGLEKRDGICVSAISSAAGGGRRSSCSGGMGEGS